MLNLLNLLLVGLPALAWPGYTHTNVTAITAAQNASTFECWEILSPIAIASADPSDPSQEQYQAINLGGVGYNTLASFPGGKTFEAHPSPKKQFSVPGGDESFVVHGGPRGLFISEDTPDVSARGHLSEVLSDNPAQLLLVDFANGTTPAHTVLHAGPCTPADQHAWWNF